MGPFFMRRNLNPGQKATLEIDLHEAEVREAARLRQVQTLKQNQNDSRWDPKSPTVAVDQEPKKGRTAEILAKQSGPIGPRVHAVEAEASAHRTGQG